MQMQARARREELRHEQKEGYNSTVQCWQDNPTQCKNLPKYYIMVLDGPSFYTCKLDAEELVNDLPDIPYDAKGIDAKIH